MSAAPWKTALVTGASSGLGRGLSGWLARRGVKVYAAARRVELLETLKAEAGELIVPLELDVSDASETFAAVGRLDAACGGLDLVVANAGVGVNTEPTKLGWDSIQRMMDVNVGGATATICGAVPGMIERGRGQLVGLSSLAGLLPLPMSSTYCATKAYLAMFLNSLRLDVEQHGLVVTSIHPGFVKTESTANNKPEAMPFLMEAQDAVERIGRAMLRREKVFSFPWQLSSLVGVAQAMPRPLQSAVLRQLR
jgi:short-subunit dehydrogenase